MADTNNQGTTPNAAQSAAYQGFSTSNIYSMIAKGAGGFLSKFPTPNADLNSNSQATAGVREGISDALISSGNPYAMLAGVATKVIDKTGGFTDASEGLGEGLDILNAVGGFVPFAGYFAPKTDDYKMSGDMQVMSSSYSGSVKDAQTAEKNAGAQFLFGTDKANAMIADAKARDAQISKIKQNADLDFLAAKTMTQNKSMANQYALQGGYQQKLTRMGRLGMQMQKAKELSLKNGGKIEQFIPTSEELNQVFFESLFNDEPLSFKNGGKIKVKMADGSGEIEIDKPDEDQKAGRKPIGHKNGKRLYLNGDGLATYAEDRVNEQTQYLQNEDKVNKNPANAQRIEKLMKEVIEPAAKNGNKTAMRLMAIDPAVYTFTDEDVANGFKGKAGAKGNVYVSSLDNYLVPGIQYVDGNLKFITDLNNSDKTQWIEFPTDEDARFFGENYHDFPELVPTLKEWSTISKHADGGQMNVIPEGSLHARLHHMENADNLTKKGIPVVDNQGEQQAEIEHSEIIFNLDTTKKVEELCKKYYSDDYTAKEKENFAIEAGKLLSVEIMENTDDRVGMLQFAEGGNIQEPDKTNKNEQTSTNN